MASLEPAYRAPAQDRMAKKQNDKGQSWSSSVLFQRDLSLFRMIPLTNV